MLDLMRKHARSWFIQVSLFAIILVFVFWGVGSFRPDSGNRIATVNDSPITISEYREVYENLVKRYRSLYGDNFSEKMLAKLNLKEKALESLIDRVLLLQEADALNLEVTKKELMESIMNYPAFQKDGVFNNSKYVRLLRYYRMAPEEFEDSQRKDLLIKKVENIIKDSAKVSDKEILDAYTMENESADFEFIRITPSSFINKVNISKEEIESYFSEHDKEYEIPAKISVQYLRFDPKSYESNVKITEEDVSDYYDMNMETYKVPKKIKARYILIKTSPEDATASVKKAREKAEKILKEIREGADFAKLAREYSDDPSAKKDGDLGLIETDKLAGPMGDAVSSLKAGETSPVIESPFGFHLVKVEKIEAARTKPLEEVRPQIKVILRREMTMDMAEDKAEDIYTRILDEDDLREFAAHEKMDINRTELFAMGEEIKGIGKGRAFSEAAFSLDKDEVSEVVKDSNVNYILQVIESQGPRIPELSEVKKAVKKAVKRKKGKAMAKKQAEELLEEIKAGKDWKHIASKKKLKIEETGSFMKRGGAIPKVGYSEKIKEEVFSMTQDNPYGDEVFQVNDNLFIVKLKSKKGIDKDKFKSAKEVFKEALLERKKGEVFRIWLEGLKEKAEIERDMSRVI